MLKTLFVLSFVFVSNMAIAHDKHPPAPPTPPAKGEKNCSVKDENVCVHLHFAHPPQLRTESVFIVHIELPNEQVAQDFDVNIYMEMKGGGHPGAPVEFVQTKPNHYKVDNAWFRMLGTWLVRTYFKVGNVEHQINVPVLIEE